MLREMGSGAIVMVGLLRHPDTDTNPVGLSLGTVPGRGLRIVCE